LSPVGSESLREEGATILVALADADIDDAPTMFELSARACRLQSQSSVGLIHGIAHVLEGLLRKAGEHDVPGHAELCATWLSPVSAFNLERSDKPRALMEAYGLDVDALQAAMRRVFDPTLYRRLLPHLRRHWKTVLRDPCTRTNSVLVRPSSIHFFEGFAPP